MIKKIRKLNLFINKYFIVFFIIPFIKPAEELMGKFDIIFDLMKLFNCIIVVYLLIFRKIKLSKATWTISFIQLIFLLATIVSSGRIWWAIVQALSIISLCIFFEYSIKKDLIETLKGICIACSFMCILTIITMFIYYPNGMYIVNGGTPNFERSNYLWGFDNSSVFNFIGSLTVFTLLKEKVKNIKLDISCLVISVLSFAAFLYVKSITASLGCFIFVIYNIITLNKKYIFKYINFRNILIVICSIFMILLIFNNKISILQKIAEKTDKVASLNYRFILWNNTIQSTNDSILIGYGYEEVSIAVSKIGLDHPHNMFLDTYYRGGLIGLALFIYLIALVLKKMMKYKNSISANILTIGMFIYLLVAQMDYYNDKYLIFVLWIFAYNIDIFIEKRSKDDNNG